TFAVMVTDNDVEKLFHADLVTRLAESFQQLEPLCQWLMTVETMKQVNPADL
ncbi:TIGR02453 family protein, partial [Salmonella enterica subsp. enterica serovar Typhimurium]|nr:TIGR02453 family protein [Salmonella enterica subsp. enterica serovar Typhimurium]